MEQPRKSGSPSKVKSQLPKIIWLKPLRVRLSVLAKEQIPRLENVPYPPSDSRVHSQSQSPIKDTVPFTTVVSNPLFEMPWSHEMNTLECCDWLVNLLSGKYSRKMVFVVSRTNIGPAWQPMGLSDLEHDSSLSDSTPMRYWQWDNKDQSRSWEHASYGCVLLRLLNTYIQDRILEPEPCLLLLQEFKFRVVSVGFH